MLILILLSLLLFGSPAQAVNHKDHGPNKNGPTLQLPPQASDTATEECCGPDPIPPGPDPTKGGH